MKDYAFLKTDSGQVVCGIGPFSEQEAPPEEGTAFYVNDFFLRDARPWKVPQEVVSSPGLQPIRALYRETQSPEIEWERMGNGLFQNVFDDIKRDIRNGAFQKSVPVLTERGTLQSGDMEALLSPLEKLAPSHFCYGYRNGNRGLLGATPEVLFSLHGRHLETMALAGTTQASLSEQFSHDAKEIHEHEFVAEYLVQKLQEIGTVRRDARQLLELGQITHFLSPIHVDLESDPHLNDLISLMHPTPALGSFPRSDSSLGRLRAYREQLGVPEHFGAPLGVLMDGVFQAVVAIRNVFWEGNRVKLPVGCGVIEESSFENEWRELGLKRRAVKQLLNL